MPTSAIVDWANDDELYYMYIWPSEQAPRQTPSFPMPLSLPRAALWSHTEDPQPAATTSAFAEDRSMDHHTLRVCS